MGTWAGGDKERSNAQESGYTASNEDDVSAGSSGRMNAANADARHPGDVQGVMGGTETGATSGEGNNPRISATGVDANTDEMGGMGITSGDTGTTASNTMDDATESPAGVGGSQGATGRNMDEVDMDGLGTSSGSQGSMTGYGTSESGSQGGSG